MPSVLSLASVIEANRLSSDIPWVFLLDIEVIDPASGAVAAVLHVANNTEDVTFQGNTYSAAAFDIQLKSELGKASEVTLSVVDYGQLLQPLLEAYGGGVGSNVTMYVVNTGNLAQGAEVVEYFQITGTTSQDYKHVFSLGAENTLMLIFPRRRQTRDFCQWRYKSFECGYGVSYMNKWRNSVDSGDCLYQPFTPQFDITVTFSVYVYFDDSDTISIDLFNVSKGTARGATFKLLDNELLSVTVTGADVFSTASARLASNYYRVWFQTTLPSSTEGADAFRARIHPVGRSGIAVGSGLYTSGAQVEFGNISAPTVFQNTTSAVGSSNKVLNATGFGAPGSAWVQSGVSMAMNPSPLWSYLPLQMPGPNTGIMPSCDLSLQGPNGCAAHNNTQNFGGFPGLNDNGYRYV
jgi:phage-related protein